MDLLEHFKAISMFDKLRHEQLELLAAQFKPRTYFPGEILIGQGDMGDRFFIFDDGGLISLRVTDANGVERNQGVLPIPAAPGSGLPPKNYMGEQMLTTRQPFEFQAYALTEIHAHILDRGDFDALLTLHPHLLHAMSFIEEAERKRRHGFEWVEEGEVVTEVFHKHWWVVIPAVAQTAAAFVVVLILSAVPGFFGMDFGNYILGGGSMVVLIFLGLQLYDWQNDEYILTTQRVAHVERQFVSIEMTEAVPLDKVIGSKIERNGIAGIIGVSNVVIQTAGRQEGNVSFKSVGNGPQIIKLLEAQRGKVRSLRAADQRERERERIQQKLREYILPHVVAQERAVVATRVPPPAPLPSPTFGRKIQKSIHALFELKTQKDVVVTWRKHWIVLLQQELKVGLGLIAFDAALVIYNLNPGFQVFPYGGYLFVGLLVLALLLFGVWWEWEDWRNDTYAVTATQVVDAERLPLGIREKSITAQLEQVQDVRVEVEGVWQSILGYGNLRIETAGQGSQMIFKNIYDPRSASEEVFKHIEALRKRILEREVDVRDRLTIDSLIGYDRIRKEEERHKHKEADAEESSRDDDDDDDDGDL